MANAIGAVATGDKLKTVDSPVYDDNGVQTGTTQSVTLGGLTAKEVSPNVYSVTASDGVFGNGGSYSYYVYQDPVTGNLSPIDVQSGSGELLDPQSPGQAVQYNKGQSGSFLAPIAQQVTPLADIVAGLTGNAEFIPVINAASGVIQGQDPATIAKNAALSYLATNVVAPAISSNVASTLVPTVGDTAANFIGNTAATVGAGEVASQGKANPITLLESGLVSQAVPLIAKDVPGYANLTTGQQAIVNQTIAGVVSGKPASQILLNDAIAAGTDAANTQAEITSNDAVLDTKVAPGASNAQVNAQLVFDASNAPDVTTAQKQADDAGYSQFKYDGKTYTINPASPTETDVANATRTGDLFQAIGYTDPTKAMQAALAADPNATGFMMGGQEYSIPKAPAPTDPLSTINAGLATVPTGSITGEGPQNPLTQLNAPIPAPPVANPVSEWDNKSNATVPGMNLTPVSQWDDKVGPQVPGMNLSPVAPPPLSARDQMINDLGGIDAITDPLTGKIFVTLPPADASIGPSDYTNVKGTISAIGNVTAGNLAGVGVAGAQLVANALGLNESSSNLANIQNGIQQANSTSLSKLTNDEQNVALGLSSALTTGALGLIGGPAAAIAGNSSIVANNTWQEGAKAGLDPVQNATRTALMTTAEVIGETIGLPGLNTMLKGIPVTATASQIMGAVKNFVASNVNEQIAEAATTTMQFGIDKIEGIGLNPNATFGDFTKALSDTAAQTFYAVGGTHVMATGANAVGQGGTNTGVDTTDQTNTPDTAPKITSGGSNASFSGYTAANDTPSAKPTGNVTSISSAPSISNVSAVGHWLCKQPGSNIGFIGACSKLGSRPISLYTGSNNN